MSRENIRLSIRTAQEAFKNAQDYLESITDCRECTQSCASGIYYIAYPSGQTLKFTSEISKHPSHLNRNDARKMQAWNDHHLSLLRSCPKEHIVVNTILIIPRSSLSLSIFGKKAFDDEKFFAHAACVLVSSRKNLAILDSSILDHSTYHVLMKNVGTAVRQSLHLPSSTTISTIGINMIGNLQGRSDLCAPWALYLLTQFMTTGNSFDRIYRSLIRKTQRERDRIIHEFLRFLATDLSVASFREQARQSLIAE